MTKKKRATSDQRKRQKPEPKSEIRKRFTPEKPQAKSKISTFFGYPVVKRAIPYIIVLLIGIYLGSGGFSKKEDKKIQNAIDRVEEFKAEADKKVDRFETLNEDLEELNKVLEDKIIADSISRSIERSKPIPLEVTTRNEGVVLEKGIELYGPAGSPNTKKSLLASYSAQAFNEVEISRRIRENQKVLILNHQGIVLVKDRIIVKYADELKYVAKRAKRKGMPQSTGLFSTLGGLALGLVLLVL